MAQGPEQDFIILTGTANPQLTQRVGDILGKETFCAIKEPFKDGEVRVQIPTNIRRRHVYIIQSPSRPDVNKGLMELELMIYAAKLASASEITAIIPYFPYARQDRKDEPRVPISAAWTAKKIAYAGASRLLTVDLHNEAIEGAPDGVVPWDNVYASFSFIPEMQKLNLGNLKVASPDPGGLKRARKYSILMGLGVQIPFADKYRPPHIKDAVETTTITGTVKDADLAFVDDILNTGATITEPAKIARELGARSVRAFVTHGLFVGDARDRIERAELDGLFVTDSVTLPEWVGFNPRVRVVSIAPLLAGAIQRIESGESISERYILHSHLNGNFHMPQGPDTALSLNSPLH